MNPLEPFIAWWLDTTQTPAVLIVVRILVGVLGILAASTALVNAVRPNEIERTWSSRDCRRWKGIAWFRALSTALAALYFFAAAMIEGDRVGSPNRLIVGNAAFALLFFGLWMDSLFWRAHYRRKRAAIQAHTLFPEGR